MLSACNWRGGGRRLPDEAPGLVGDTNFLVPRPSPRCSDSRPCPELSPSAIRLGQGQGAPCGEPQLSGPHQASVRNPHGRFPEGDQAQRSEASRPSERSWGRGGSFGLRLGAGSWLCARA